MITIADVYRLADEAMRDPQMSERHNPYFQPSEDDFDMEGFCLYFKDEPTDDENERCIAGHILHELGINPPLERSSVGDLVYDNNDFSDGAAALLVDLQQYADAQFSLEPPKKWGTLPLDDLLKNVGEHL